MAFADRLRRAMESRGVDQTALAHALGITSQAVTQWANGKTMPTGKRMAEVASVLGISAATLMDPEGIAANDTGSPAAPRDRTRGGFAPAGLTLPAPASLHWDLPVRGSAEGGPDGAFELLDTSTMAMDMVRRPPGLQGIRDAFALYTAGDSMSPWREPGDLVFIQPGRQPRPGSYVVVVLRPSAEGEPRRAMVKRLVRRSAAKVIVEQFNPPRQIEIPAGEIEDLWRVIDWQEALGFT